MQNNTAEIQFRLYASGRPQAENGLAAPQSGSGRLPRITQILALAIHFQDMIQRRRGEGLRRPCSAGLRNTGTDEPDYGIGLARPRHPAGDSGVQADNCAAIPR